MTIIHDAQASEWAQGSAETLNSGKGGDAGGDQILGFEDIHGSDFADTLFGDLDANDLMGGDGANWLAGGFGKDILRSGAAASLAGASRSR